MSNNLIGQSLQNIEDATDGSEEIPVQSISREQWLERCATVLREKGGLDPLVALNVAESQLENCDGDLTENPEDAADDEMSYW